MTSSWVDHVLSAVEAAPILSDPWSHAILSNVWPVDMYAELIAQRPSWDEMVPLSNYTPNRRMIWLEQDSEVANAYWRGIRDELFPSLAEAVQRKFNVRGSRWGGQLVRDLVGYNLRAHTDMPHRVVTTLLYLPETAEHADRGTVLLRGKDPDPEGQDRDPADFEQVKIVPYVPNTGLVFARTDWTYHMVQQTPVERWLLAHDVLR